MRFSINPGRQVCSRLFALLSDSEPSQYIKLQNDPRPPYCLEGCGVVSAQFFQRCSTVQSDHFKGVTIETRKLPILQLILKTVLPY